MKWFLLLVFLYRNSVHGLEATWTPADGEGGGPLPLSQNQRHQLLELERVIASSPDPENTLRKVAESNGMSVQDLAGMIERNRRDLEGVSRAGSQVTSLPRMTIQLFASLGMAMLRGALSHPRPSLLILLTLLAISYGMYTTPRTGLVLSTGHSWVSGGRTTWFRPPDQYLMDLPYQAASCQPMARREITDEDDGVIFHSVGRGSPHKDWAMAVTSRKTLELEMELDDDDVTELAFDCGTEVWKSRRFSEFTHDTLRWVTKPHRKRACLVVPSMGDFGRFGIQPLGVASEETLQKSVDERFVEVKEIAFHTTKGGHFDGNVCFGLEKWGHQKEEEEGASKTKKESDDVSTDSSQPNDKVVVTVRLVVPKGGRVLNQKLARSIVQELTNSIVSTVQLDLQRKLALHRSGRRLSERSRLQAQKLRTVRASSAQKLEEMADDRKRRWKRGGTGDRYRPSGQRQRSPHHC